MADFGFDDSFRLKSASDFNYLRSNSSRASNKFFICYFKKSKIDSDRTRLGLAVSKKLGNAVVRNKLKRLMREYFRNSTYKKLGLDILVVPSNRLKDQVFEDGFNSMFTGHLEDLFKKINKEQ